MIAGYGYVADYFISLFSTFCLSKKWSKKDTNAQKS